MRKLALLFLLLPTMAFAQTGKNTCEILEKLNKLIQKDHYRPKPVDDSLSVFVFDTFIDELDENRNLFTKSEYEKLATHRLLLDNYIKSGNCAFLDDFIAIYESALQRKKAVLEKVRSIPMDYQTNDSIKFSREKFSFDLVESDFEKVWTKRMRFEILQDISKMGTKLDSLQQHFDKLEKTSNKKIFDNNICQTDNLLNDSRGIGATLQTNFLNVFCTYFDPHTNYFSSDGKASFLSVLSTSNLSLGFNVRINENEEIVIEDIVPGGPAAQSKMFEKGDLIVRVSNNKGQEYLVSCSALETIGEMIFSDANKEIKLTLRKKNGTEVDVTLTKQVLKATQNNVYSFITEGETRTGYIKIPNFYADFESGTAQGCALDVFMAIIKLTEEGIDGLVIDLLDNGGGSMDEAIKLASLFVNQGPVVVLSDGKNKQHIVNDNFPSLAYDGPMIILQNGNSASASELFAGVMQDYNRAIVVGSPSLGKATMQTFLPFKVRGQENFVKLTVEKFFRVSGDSNQIKGIVPNVAMPVLFDSIVPREKSFKTALPYNEIATKAKFGKYAPFFDSKIIRKSYERIGQDARMNEVKNLNKKINRLYSMPIPAVRLTFKDVFTLIRETEDVWDRVKKVAEESNNLSIKNTEYDQSQINSDAFLKDINDYRLKDAASNPYLKEATMIIDDYVKSGN